MKHALQPIRPRLQRSQLAVPGANPGMIEKAAKTEADYVFLDLEDAVAPDDKAQARKNVIAALGDIDWKGSGKSVSVRINGPDTHYMYRDVVDVIEQAGEHLDGILVPKVSAQEDVHMIETLCEQIECAKNLRRRIAVEALIESALGMVNVEAIARRAIAPGGRLEALHFGVGDFAASCRARTTSIGGLNPDYPGDPWHSALTRMLTACRAYGLRAVDGPFGDIKDAGGFLESAERAAALGMDGKWVIHPSQIELANKVFTPPPEEVARAKDILRALESAAEAGQGAAQLEGKMIDAASKRMAENVVAIADLIAAGELAQQKK